MSNKTVFSVLDSAANAFGNPFVVNHLGIALRAFTDQVNSESGGDLFNHPADFALYQIGEYDDTTGVITPLTPPKLIVQAASLKNVRE